MSEIPAAVAAVITALETGEWAPVRGALAEDVFYDGWVPEWHFQMAGIEDVFTELSGMTAQHIWRFHTLRTTRTDKGVLLECEMRGRCPGDDGHPAHEEASHNALVFELDGAGRIAELRLTCSGEWDEKVIARIEAEAPKVQR